MSVATKKYRYGYLLDDLTQETLKTILSYDPKTGLFVRLAGQNVGQVAGSRNPNNGNVQIRVSGRLYLAHRLAYLYMTGEWPKDEIDHDDGNRSNNCWRNLRPATHAENHQNEKRRTDNKTGCSGVHRREDGLYEARVNVNLERHVLGFFENLSEAVAARIAAKARLHKFKPVDRDPPCVK